MRYRLAILLLFFLILIFPNAILTHSSSITDVDRTSTLESSEDEDGVIGIKKQSSIQVDSRSEKLVDIKNNLGTDVTSTVQLEKNIGWNFQGNNEESKVITTGQQKSFFVNTESVSPLEKRGSYTVENIKGSFRLSSERTVEFISGGFETTVGGNSSIALIKNTDANGEPLNVSGNRLYPSTSYSYSTNDTSVVSVSEKSSCSNNLKQKGNCSVNVIPNSKGTARVQVSNGAGSSDSILVKVTSAPFFLDTEVTQEPVEGQSSVKIKVFARNDGVGKSSTEVRLDPSFASPKVKTYNGISQNNTGSREFVFQTQSGDSGDYTANINSFEVGDIGGRIISSDSASFSILSSDSGIIVEGLSVRNEDGTVNETERMKFKIQVKNSASTTKTGNVEIFNSSIGSNSTSVTLDPSEQSNVNLSLKTSIGDRGQPIFTAKTDNSKVSNNFDVKRSVPRIEEFIVTNTNATESNSDVTYKLKATAVRNNDISDVRLNLTVNGNTDSTLLLDDGSITGNEDGGGPIKNDGEQVQTDNSIIIDAPAKIKKGDIVKSKLIVNQSDRFEKTNTTLTTVP